MNDTIDSVVAQENFLSLNHANAAGYFRPWQLKRRDLKPDGSEPRASLFDAVPQADLDDEIFGRSFYMSCPDSVVIGDTICTNRRALYSTSQTKPYHPTDRTRAIWVYQDVFVPNWKQYRYHDGERWCEVKASVYRDGLNESTIKDHLCGWQRCQVYAGRSTRFVAARVQHASAEQVLAKAERIKDQLFAQKWFCQVSADGVTIYWIFRLPNKTDYVVRRLRALLGGIPATIGPTSQVAIDLPLCRGCLTFVDRLLPTVEHKTGPEEDVVGLADWITEKAGNPTPADVLSAYRRQQEEREDRHEQGDLQGKQQRQQRPQEQEDHHQLDLLSIAVQFDQDDLQGGQPADMEQGEFDRALSLLQRSFHEIDERQQATEVQQPDTDDHHRSDQDDNQERQQDDNNQAEDRHQLDLLSIAVQLEQISLKNRCWRVITGFFRGQEPLPLNTAILLGARILLFEGLAADAAKTILLDYCHAIPNPTSSRLVDPGMDDVLKKDVGRAVDAVYQNNGRQHDAGTSTPKMQKAVATWRSKGLVFSDKTTWDTTYGYAAVPAAEFTEQERQNIKSLLATTVVQS